MGNIISDRNTATSIMDSQYFNLLVRDWTKLSIRDLRRELSLLEVKFSANNNSLNKVLRSNIRNHRGVASRISFNMPQHGIFLHKGVGKGRPINRPKGAKLWFNPVITRNLPLLADAVADNQANTIVNSFNIH